MAATTVHHVGIGVLDEAPMLNLFQDRLNFRLVSKRCTAVDAKWVLQKNNVVFVITKMSDHIVEQLSSSTLSRESCYDQTVDQCSDLVRSPAAVQAAVRTNCDAAITTFPDFSTIWCHPGTGVEPLLTNSVYEICLEVRDVAATVERAKKAGAVLLRPVTTIHCDDGSVTYAVIRSCVGNVQHTLVNTTNYRGDFLPGFDVYPKDEINNSDNIGEIAYDHITICVSPGYTIKSMAWYEECFHMNRLIVNKDESATDGLVLDEIGMRMAAMEYWRCAESGLSLGKNQDSAKFVFAESLTNAPNQVTTFITQHGGPGVQHIGFKTDRLVEVVHYLKQQQLPFVQPPPEYYREIGKLAEIAECGESVDLLETCGILLDSEADSVADSDSKEENQNRYLMQIFTKPIFNEDTFFLEFLQRHGAHGFGAGNVIALFRAVKLYMEKKSLVTLR